MKSLCEHCKIKTQVEKNILPEIFRRYIDEDMINVYKSNPTGCEKCNK